MKLPMANARLRRGVCCRSFGGSIANTSDAFHLESGACKVQGAPTGPHVGATASKRSVRTKATLLIVGPPLEGCNARCMVAIACFARCSWPRMLIHSTAS